MLSSAQPSRDKENVDAVQSVHAKTLSCCFVIKTASKTWDVVAVKFLDMMEDIMECGTRMMPLHLKIAGWHNDLLRNDVARKCPSTSAN